MYLIWDSWSVNGSHAEFPPEIVFEPYSSNTAKAVGHNEPEPSVSKMRVFHRAQWEHHHMENKENQHDASHA